MVRGVGDSEDTAEPTKLSFPKESDEPTQTSTSAPSTGGGTGGGTTGGQTNVAATLAAALDCRSISSADVGSSGDVSKDDVLRYTHMASLSSNVALGHTFLLVADLMQEPKFVARIQASYDSAAERIKRDIEHLEEGADAQLERTVLHYARPALAAGIDAGQTNCFVRLEQRLTLIAAERELVEDNEETMARLRGEIGRLAADALGRQHPTPETMPKWYLDTLHGLRLSLGPSWKWKAGLGGCGTSPELRALYTDDLPLARWAEPPTNSTNRPKPSPTRQSGAG